MKKAFIGIVFLAAVNMAFAQGSMWAGSDRVVYDGESEILFSYTGPEGVSARVYEDGNFLGSLVTGETKRRIVSDGGHTFTVHSGVYNAATEQTVENPQALNLFFVARKNRDTVKIVISKTNGQNRVTDLTLTGSVAIQTRPKPRQDQASGQNQNEAAAAPADQEEVRVLFTGKALEPPPVTTVTVTAPEEKTVTVTATAPAPPPARQSETYYARGTQHYMREAWYDAIANFTHAIERNPSYVEAYIWRANAYMRIGKYAWAAADVEKASQLNPDAPGLQEALKMLRQRY